MINRVIIIPIVFSLWTTLLPAFAQNVQKLDFSDDPFYISPGPDKGVPSPEGNCIGSGCSPTLQGEGFGANTPENSVKPQYPAQQGGDTNFRVGSQEYGPTWSNGGYMGTGADPIPGSFEGPVMEKFRLSQLQAIMAVTPDNLFPRKQIFNDLNVLRQISSGLDSNKLVRKYPRILAPLPPTIAQYIKLSDDLFEKNLGPLRDSGTVQTNWENWKQNLRTKTVQSMISVGWQRDMPLAEAYLVEITNAIDAQERVVNSKANQMLGNYRTGPMILYQHPWRDMSVKAFEIGTTAEALARANLADPIVPNTNDIVRKTSDELTKRSTNISPPLPQGGVARMLADFAIAEAIYLTSDDQVAEAVVMQEVSAQLLSLSLALTPFVGEGVAAYEYLTGKSFVDGSEISPEQRTIIGVMLAGKFLRASAPAALKGLDRLKREADALNVSKSDVIAMKGYPKSIKRYRSPDFGEITGIRQGFEHNTDAAVARGKRLLSDRRPWATDKIVYEPAWQSSELVVDGKISESMRVVRIHNSSNRNGTWLATEGDVSGLTAVEIQNRFNLPSTPTFRSDVTLPTGTQIRYGRVGKNAFGVSEGWVQIEVPAGTLRDDWFSPAVPLK